MSLQVVLLLVCQLLTCVTVCPGLEVTIDRTPGSQYCAQLRCEQTVSQTDHQISYIIGLSIYNLTLDNSKVKFASISEFDPDLYIDQSKVEVVNGTGRVTKTQGQLILSFQDVNDCVDGSFLCELDFVDVTGQPGTIMEVTVPGNNSSCALFEQQLRTLTVRVNSLTSNTQTALAALEQENIVLEGKVTLLTDENMALKSSLDHVIQRLDKLEAQDPQLACSRNTTRPEFLLFGYILALCDTETDGGGWVIIQRRTTGEMNFYKTWTEYKKGFGTPDTDFWIGLDAIHSLTSMGYTELRVDLDFGGSPFFAHYPKFSIASESSNYRLSMLGYSGTAGEGLAAHNNMNFSTYDMDNNQYPESCADTARSGWWFSDQGCWFSNLNGPWGLVSHGVTWSTLGSTSSSSAHLTEMKLRRP